MNPNRAEAQVAHQNQAEQVEPQVRQAWPQEHQAARTDAPQVRPVVQAVVLQARQAGLVALDGPVELAVLQVGHQGERPEHQAGQELALQVVQQALPGEPAERAERVPLAEGVQEQSVVPAADQAWALQAEAPRRGYLRRAT